jgi:hypothetical protein
MRIFDYASVGVLPPLLEEGKKLKEANSEVANSE